MYKECFGLIPLPLPLWKKGRHTSKILRLRILRYSSTLARVTQAKCEGKEYFLFCSVPTFTVSCIRWSRLEKMIIIEIILMKNNENKDDADEYDNIISNN